MKTMALTTFLAFSLLSFSANAGFLSARGFLGHHNGKDKVNLLLKEAPGREGSFFAVLIKADKKISLYLVDSLDANSYSMTPLEVTDDGEIGIVNDNPSLVITVAKNKKGKDIFKIMSSNSDNSNGFNGFFEFQGKESSLEWKGIEDGEYKKEYKVKNTQSKVSSALQISRENLAERETTAVFMTSSLSGTFTLREKFPGMYLLNQNAILATGTKTSEAPKAIGIFLKDSNDTEMLLIEPQDDTKITTFIKK